MKRPNDFGKEGKIMNNEENLTQENDLKEIPADIRESSQYIAPDYSDNREKLLKSRISFIKNILYIIAAAFIFVPAVITIGSQENFTFTSVASKILLAVAVFFWECGMGCAAYLLRKDRKSFKERVAWMIAAVVWFVVYLFT